MYPRHGFGRVPSSMLFDVAPDPKAVASSYSGNPLFEPNGLNQVQARPLPAPARRSYRIRGLSGRGGPAGPGASTGGISAGVSVSAGNMTEQDLVLGGTAGPQISDVDATGITDDSATITWETDQAATSQVEYGPTTAYGNVGGWPGTLNGHSTSESTALPMIPSRDSANSSRTSCTPWILVTAPRTPPTMPWLSFPIRLLRFAGHSALGPATPPTASELTLWTKSAGPSAWPP